VAPVAGSFFDLRDGKIAGWRDDFDLGASDADSDGHRDSPVLLALLALALAAVGILRFRSR